MTSLEREKSSKKQNNIHTQTFKRQFSCTHVYISYWTCPVSNKVKDNGEKREDLIFALEIDFPNSDLNLDKHR